MTARGTVPTARRATAVWDWIRHAFRRGAKVEPGVDPVPWTPPVTSRTARARAFLPSPGVVASLVIAGGAWAWVATCLESVDPYAPYVLVSFLGAVATAVAAMLAPLLRLFATRYGTTRAFREAAWWHGVRQGVLVGAVVAANGFLLALRQWAVAAAVAVGLGAVAIEVAFLAVLLTAPRRPR